MTKKMSETVKSATSIPIPVLEVFNGPFASAVSQNSEALAKGMQVVPSELGEFVATRIKANVALYTQCSKCSDWSDLMDIQQKWLKDTSQAYTDQANTIISMTQSMFEQSNGTASIPDIATSEKMHD